MMLIVQIILVLVVCGILLAVARSMPATIDPWIRWGVYALAGLLVCVWLLGLAGLLGPVGWYRPLR